MKIMMRGYCLLGSLIMLTACGDKAFDVDKAKEKGDVINIHGKITNLDRFYDFQKNVEAKVESKVNITQLTIEGDPIYYHLAYKKGELTYKYDNSEDEHGGNEKMSTVCKGFVTEKVERGTAYTLEGCKSSKAEQTFIFVVPDNQ